MYNVERIPKIIYEPTLDGGSEFFRFEVVNDICFKSGTDVFLSFALIWIFLMMFR